MTRNAMMMVTGIGVLLAIWAGPLPRMAAGSFTAHMMMHILVVAFAVPLIAAGLSATGRGTQSSLALPVIASIVDLVVVWGWHMPTAHLAASTGSAAMVMQQSSFAAAALFVWLVAFRASPLAGALELFFTAMHMVLLGTLISLAPRPLYSSVCLGGYGLDPLADQQLGGTLMLVFGGTIYMAGGLFLVQQLLRVKATP